MEECKLLCTAEEADVVFVIFGVIFSGSSCSCRAA